MSATVSTLTVAAIEAAKLYLDYAARAQEMTLEQAQAEWSRVQARSKAAGDRWDSGETP